MTPNAEAFVKANSRAAIVEGRVIGRGGEGVIYRLEDGSSYRLSAAECREVEYPRWLNQ